MGSCYTILLKFCGLTIMIPPILATLLATLTSEGLFFVQIWLTSYLWTVGYSILLKPYDLIKMTSSEIVTVIFMELGPLCFLSFQMC